MKNKKTARNTPKRFPSVGPITSRDQIGPLNIRTQLNIAIRKWRNAERKAKQRAEQAEGALEAWLKNGKE